MSVPLNRTSCGRVFKSECSWHHPGLFCWSVDLVHVSLWLSSSASLPYAVASRTDTNCPLSVGVDERDGRWERLTRTGPKRLHFLYKYILSKFNAYNMNAHSHARLWRVAMSAAAFRSSARSLFPCCHPVLFYSSKELVGIRQHVSVFQYSFESTHKGVN